MTKQSKREIGRIGMALIVSALSIPIGLWAWSVEEKADEHNRNSIEISDFAHESSDDIRRAMAEAFQTGRLGIADYYQLRNVQADTDMRRAIAAVDTTKSVTN